MGREWMPDNTFSLMAHIFTVCGSLRPGSIHALLLDTAETQLRSAGATIDRYADLISLPRYLQDHDVPGHPEAEALRDRIAAADRVLIACPTYNLSIPSGMKDLIDWASRPFGKSCFRGKPVALIGVGVGNGYGAMARDYLSAILGFLGASVLAPHTSGARVMGHLDLEARTIDDDLTSRISATVAALLAV